jgi:hypothetical protein
VGIVVGMIVGIGTGTSAGISTGMLIEAVYKYQAEVAVPKYVYVAPHKVLCNRGITVIRIIF